MQCCAIVPIVQDGGAESHKIMEKHCSKAIKMNIIIGLLGCQAWKFVLFLHHPLNQIKRVPSLSSVMCSPTLLCLSRLLMPSTDWNSGPAKSICSSSKTVGG